MGNAARVLDFDCGTATLAVLVKRRFPGARVRGLDVDEEILAKARRKAAADGADVGLDHCDGGRFPYPDGSFGRVVTCFVLHHLDDSLRREAFAVIRLLDGRRNARANAQGRRRATIAAARLDRAEEISRQAAAMGEVSFILGVNDEREAPEEAAPSRISRPLDSPLSR